MTEKVCLADIKRTPNRRSPLRLCVLCGKKTNPKRRTMVYARKSLSSAHKTRIKPTAWRGGLCRDYGGKWRFLSQYMAENGGIMVDYVAHFVTLVAHFVTLVAYFVTLVADYGVFCRDYGGLWRILSGLWRTLSQHAR